MIELTEQQRQAVRNGEAVRVAVPELGEDVVLQRATQYEMIVATAGTANGAPSAEAPARQDRRPDPVAPPASTEPLVHREAFLKLPEEEQRNLVVGDLWWANDCLAAGAFTPYLDKYVAVSCRRVLGADPDPVALREEVALKFDLEPRQVAIISGPQTRYYEDEMRVALMPD